MSRIVTPSWSRDRNELNKAILSARVTPQWILMNFFKSQPHSIVLCLRIILVVRVVGLEYFCEVSLFYLMTAAQFWVSALRLALGFTQCREREEGAPSFISVSLLLILLSAASWDRVTRVISDGDSLPPSQVSTSQVCLRVGAGAGQRITRAELSSETPTAVSSVQLCACLDFFIRTKYWELISWLSALPVFIQIVKWPTHS